jgi:hypothetical protein
MAAVTLACGCAPTASGNATSETAVRADSLAAALPQEDQERLAAAVVSALSQRIWFGGMGSQYRCTDEYSIGLPHVDDVSITGDSGKMRISVPITGVRPVPNQNFFPRPDMCYGAPPNGWNIGLTATSTYVVNIEKWQSGWRVADGQNLMPAG